MKEITLVVFEDFFNEIDCCGGHTTGIFGQHHDAIGIGAFRQPKKCAPRSVGGKEDPIFQRGYFVEEAASNQSTRMRSGKQEAEIFVSDESLDRGLKNMVFKEPAAGGYPFNGHYQRSIFHDTAHRRDNKINRGSNLRQDRQMAPGRR